MIYSSISQLQKVNELFSGDIFQLPNKGKNIGYVQYHLRNGDQPYIAWLDGGGDAKNYEPTVKFLRNTLGITQEDIEFIAKQVVGLDYDEDIVKRDSGMPNIFHYFGRDSFNRVAWRFFHELGMYIEDILQHGVPQKNDVEVAVQGDHTIFDFTTVRIIVNGKPEHYIQ